MGQAKSTQNHKPKSSLILTVVIIICAVVAAFFLRQYIEKHSHQENQRQRTYAEMVEKDHPFLVKFQEEYPQREVVLACEDDVTNDQKKDLLIIYKESSKTKEKITRLVVAVADKDGSCVYTEPIPAPIENQGIQFKNIDGENEMEFVVSGEKDGTAGFAIYRMIDGVPVDLFGEGMEDCC